MAGKTSGMQVSVSAEEWKKKQASSGGESSESQSASKSASKLVRDSNRFMQSAKKDLNKENYFDAADYFEERKKQAEDLKKRAAAAANQLEANADSYAPEYYNTMVEYLSNFDTMVDDVMSNYKPSLESREGMRAYEDEMIATMERNSRYVDERKPHNGTLLSYNEDTEDFIPDYSYRSVNSNWTPEQRYTLGHLQLQNPEEAQKYATEVNKYLSNMGMYAEQERKRKEMAALDLDAAKREIDQLQAELDNFYATNDYTADAEYRQKQKELTQKTTLYNQAKRQQEAEAFRSVTGNDDFVAKSGYVSTEAQNFRDRMFSEYGMGYNDLTYEYINDPERVQAYNDEFTRRMLESNYELMQNDEIAIYNYLHATEGKDKAQAYLDSIQEDLNRRRAEQIYSDLEGKTAKEIAFGVNAGLNQFMTSTKNLLSNADYLPVSATQQASQIVRQDLQDRAAIKKAETGAGSIAPLLYDITTTTANMLPSMAAGALANVVLPGSGAYVGSALMGASAAGGAYQEAINSGYNKEQARTYSTMVGVAETGMEAMLGFVGGGMPDAIKKKAIDAVDGAIAKFAIEQGANMISEGFEEGLQEVISPWIENVFLMAEKENADIKDVAYASLLGALSTLPFAAVEGGKTAVTSWASRRAAPATATAPAVEAKTFQPPVETPNVSTEGKAMKISSKEALDVKDFASMSDNGATIMTNDGDVVDYDDVSFANQQQANQFYAVRSLPGLDTEAANDLLTAIQSADAGQDTDSVVGIRDAYRIGYFNQDVKALKTGDASVLSPELRQAVYDIGVRQNQAEAAMKASAVAVTTKPSDGYKKVTLEGNIKLNTSQKSQVDFIDKFSDKVSKTSVHVFESYVKNGKRYYKDSNGKEVLAPNGKYVNGEIWVDLKAGDKGEGLVLNTFAHELYHHIEAQNKADANKLAGFVSKSLGIKAVDRAVDAQIQKARAAGFGEKYFTDRGMSAEQARNEVYSRAMSDFVADSLETMFTRGDTADAIAQLYKEDRTLFDKIKEFIDKFISQVKEFYSDKTISQEGAAVAQLENFQELQRMFMEAVKGAGENYQAAEVVDKKSTTQDGDAMYSERNDAKITLGMTDSERAEILKNKVITAPVYAGQAQIAITERTNNLESHKESLIKSALVKIGEEFGVFTDYRIADVEVDIRLSKGNLKESISKKINPGQIAKLLPVMKTAVENAVGIECHANRYFYDNNTVMFENLMGGYVDGDYFVPVRFGLRHSVAGNATLYLIVDQEKININKIKAEVAKATVMQKHHADNTSRSAFKFSLTNIIPFVNGKDILRYLPDDMLTEDQKKAKWDAIAETVKYTNDKNDKHYIDCLQSGNLAGAMQMVRQAAKAAGYTKMFFHGAKKGGGFTRFREWSYFTENKQYAERYAQRDNPGSLYTLYGKMEKPFDTRNSETKAIFEDIRNEYGLSELQDTGLPDWTDGYDITDYINANNLDYDGVILDEGGDMVDGKPVSRGLSYVLRNSEQVKSADVITYDDNGNIIPISQRFDSENEDIRYSLRNEKPLTNRQILEQLDIVKRKPGERDHLQRYQERRDLLSQEKPKLESVNAQIKELSADPKQNKAELTQLKAEARALKRSVDSLSRKIREQEQSEMFKRIATEERLRLMKETGKNAQKSYKNEQRKMVEAMNMDQRMIREMLTGTQSLMSRMEDNFIDLEQQMAVPSEPRGNL